MTKFSCKICLKKMQFEIQGKSIPCFSNESTVVHCSRVVLTEDIVIPANCELLAPALVESPNFHEGNAIVEPIEKFMEKHDIPISKSLVDIKSESVPVRYLNFKDENLKLYKGSVVATIESVQDIENEKLVRALYSKNNGSEDQSQTHLDQIIERVHGSVSVKEKQKLATLLWEYRSSFSCSSSDVGSTNLVEHKINTGDTPSIKQIPRRIPLAKMAETKKEINDMLERGVIETSDSPWSSPIVLVKKKGWDNPVLYRL